MFPYSSHDHHLPNQSEIVFVPLHKERCYFDSNLDRIFSTTAALTLDIIPPRFGGIRLILSLGNSTFSSKTKAAFDRVYPVHELRPRRHWNTSAARVIRFTTSLNELVLQFGLIGDCRHALIHSRTWDRTVLASCALPWVQAFVDGNFDGMGLIFRF